MGLLGESVLLAVLIGLSGFFSGVETAFTSFSKIRITHLLENKKSGIGLVKKLKDNKERLLITILIGNNLVNIAATSIATSVSIRLMGSHAVGVAVGFMTFIILVFGEITPKTVAMAKNEWIAIRTAPIIWVLQFVFYPAIRLLEWLSLVISWPLSMGDVRPIITEDEIKTVVSIGEEIGEVEEDEMIMIHNIFRFSDLEASEIMVDRTQIFSISSDKTVMDVAPQIVERGYSRVPVYEEKPDRMVGILYAKDLLQALLQGDNDTPVKQLARRPMFIPETVLIDDLLKEFQQKKIHMALVVDEHGGVSGLVTIEDLLEEIVGDIVDETDKETVRIQKVGRNKALVKGETEVEEVNQKLGLKLSEHEDYETISGLVLSRLRRIPQVGEELLAGEVMIRVTKANRQRIIEVEIERMVRQKSQASKE